MEIRFLGTRGSMPTGGAEYLRYGSDTSSYLVTTEKDAIFLDAGTGICHAPYVPEKRISIIISHPHLDHIMGLPFFSMLSKPTDIDIYSAAESEKLQAILEQVFSPPIWPCTLYDYAANITIKKLEPQMKLGNVIVSEIDGSHPGGCSVIRIDNKEASVCYATDYEQGERDEQLIKFARNCDYLICDGQYTIEEYEKCKGYGHSTKERWIEISKSAGIKNVIFTHHDPRHSDGFLDSEEQRIRKLFNNARLAKQGEVINI